MLHYAARLLIGSAGGETIFSGSAEAGLEEGTTVLHLDLRTSLAREGGAYILKIRRQDSEWLSYQLRVLQRR
jgi:hypothetical protein